jgi:hypothetical protein
MLGIFLLLHSARFLPAARKQAFAGKRIALDLHGMNVAAAHSAVRIALQQEVVGLESNILGQICLLSLDKVV